MTALTFNKTCFCIEQKTICYVVAYLILVINLLGMAITIFITILAIICYRSKSHFEIFLSIIFTYFAIILFTILTVNITFNIVLLIGLHKNKPRCIIAFMVYLVVIMIGVLINLIAGCNFCDFIVGQSDGTNDTILTVVVVVFGIIYLFLLRKTYRQMKEQTEQSPTETNNTNTAV